MNRTKKQQNNRSEPTHCEAGQCPIRDGEVRCGLCLAPEPEDDTSRPCPGCQEGERGHCSCQDEEQAEAHVSQQVELPRAMTTLVLATFLATVLGMYIAHELIFFPGLMD